MNYSGYPNYQYPYAPMYYQPQMQVPTPSTNVGNTQPISANPLILDTVSGRTAADIYNVDMGKQAILIDIDNPVIYKKTRDMNNKLEMEVYDLVPHIDKDASVQQADLKDYLKKEAIEEIVSDRVKEEVDRRLSEISFTPAPKTRKKVSEE